MVQEFKAQPVILNVSAAEPNAINDAVREIMESRIKTFNPFRRERIPEWNINIAYLCGYQNIGYNGINITLMPNTSLFSIVVNKIGPAVRNDVAMATKVPPKFDIVPDTTDENDRQTAIAGEKMSGYLRRINDFDKSRGMIIIWYDIAGIAWRKQYWDAQYKMIGLNPGPDEPNHNPDIEVGEPIYQGEALSEHTPTNEMIWDWRANTERLPWAIHAQPRSYGDLLGSFPDTAPNIPDSAFLDPNAGMNEFEIKVYNDFRQFANTGGNKTRPDASQMGKRDKEVMVYEFWQVADSNYPVGVLATMAGMEPGTILSNAPYPIESYPHGEVPFTAYDMMVPDKSVVGRASRISQARPIQRELNDIRTLVRENTAALGNGVIYSPREAKLNLKRLDNAPGLVIEYDGFKRPQREQGQPVAGQLFLYAREIVGDINDIFSFPQVAQGKRPQGGPKSGIGIALLQESAVAQHSPIINEMDRRDERAMNQLLSVAYANYGQRTFEIFGKDNEWIGFEFDPNSHSSKFNVVVRSGSSLPISKVLEQDTTLGLLDRGLLGNPQDPSVKKRVLEHLAIGGLDNILKEKNKDVNFAKKEFQVPVQQYQEMLKQAGGEVTDEILEQIFLPNVTIFDDHEVHIIEHKNDLLDKYYQYLGTGDPGMILIAQAMQAHFAEHSRILSEIQISQAIMTGQIKREDLESSQEKESAKESNND